MISMPSLWHTNLYNSTAISKITLILLKMNTNSLIVMILSGAQKMAGTRGNHLWCPYNWSVLVTPMMVQDTEAYSVTPPWLLVWISLSLTLPLSFRNPAQTWLLQEALLTCHGVFLCSWCLCTLHRTKLIVLLIILCPHQFPSLMIQQQIHGAEGSSLLIHLHRSQGQGSSENVWWVNE